MLKKSKFLVFMAVLFLSYNALAKSSMQCLNLNGDPVDWWVILKLPTNSVPDTGGVSFFYFDQTGKKYFSDGNHAITRSDHPLAYTLNQIYDDSVNASTAKSWVIYNDEPATNAKASAQSIYDFTHGHTKGVLGFDDTSGFWLIQSVPGFPPAKEDGYSYPDSGKLNGQSMLCISLSSSNFENIGKQFVYSNPNVYSSHFHNAALAPTLKAIVTKTSAPKTDPKFNDQEYTSLNGTTKFQSYVQTNTHSALENADPQNHDFYACMANDDNSQCNNGFLHPLQNSLFVQTWLLSNTPEKQICELKYHVNNADAYKLTDNNSTTYTWETKNDHSKWAISTEPNSDIICIGDLNRTEQQKLRGGGAMCFANKELHEVMLQMITKTDPCA